MGTLRLLLTQPISRTQVLASKYIAGAMYTALIVVWLGILAIGLGHGMFGSGDLMVLNSDGLVIIPEYDIAWRYIGAFAVAFLALNTVATLSIALSCFSDNSVGPIVATMSIIILFTIIGTLDVSVFDSIRPYLFTTHMAAWRSFFEDPFPIEEIKISVWVLLIHQALFWIISFVYFNRKDITT